MKEDVIKNALQVIDDEIAGLNALKKQIGSGFLSLVDECIATTSDGGKLVLTGVGKSAHIARKISATLTSTGTPTVFMHPTEAMHGDLGILSKKDLLVAISYSGETDELLVILPAVQKIGPRMAAIVGNTGSRLAKEASIIVPMKIPKEACPFNLAPTVSTTVLTSLGDALAITIMKQRGFTLDDYGCLHPAGAIGRSLTMRVKDIMSDDHNIVKVHRSDSVEDIVNSFRDGSIVILDGDERPCGFIKSIKSISEDDYSKTFGEFSDSYESAYECFQIDGMAVEAVKRLSSEADFLVVDEDGKYAGVIDKANPILKKFKI